MYKRHERKKAYAGINSEIPQSNLTGLPDAGIVVQHN